MQTQLQKAIDLIKKTGDRLLVFDSAKSDNVYAIMNLKDYENLVLGKSEVRGLTEDELLDKINRDIAIWKSEQDMELSQKEIHSVFEVSKNREFTPINDILDKTDKEKQLPKSNHWRIPRDIKDGAEEIIEEDTQYLENI